MPNQFQIWANDYARAYGFVVTQRGNWVILHRDGQEIECLTVQGVQAACALVKQTA